MQQKEWNSEVQKIAKIMARVLGNSWEYWAEAALAIWKEYVPGIADEELLADLNVYIAAEEERKRREWER